MTLLLLGLLLGTPAAPWPTKAWPEATPESQGLDRATLEALSSEFAAGQHGYVAAVEK